MLRTGNKRAKIGSTSKSKDREKKRSESPLRIKSKTGMFSEVKDNISIPGAKEDIIIVEETANEEYGETLAEGVDCGTKDQERMDFTSIEQDYEDEDYVWAEHRTVMEGDIATHKAVADVEKTLREWMRKGEKQDHETHEEWERKLRVKALKSLKKQAEEEDSDLGSESLNSDDDTVGDEESGEDTSNTSSSEEDENMEDDSQEGGDQEDGESGDGGAPGGANL